MNSIRIYLTLFLISIWGSPALADSGFNRCKKFVSHPAVDLYTGHVYRPVAPRGVPAPLQKTLPFIKKPRPDYAGYLHVIEIAREPSGYQYWFWDLRTGRLITGPESEQPALWRSDSRLFIAPTASNQASQFDQQGYRGNQGKDTARYYIWDENQHDPAQSELLLLPCGE